MKIEKYVPVEVEVEVEGITLLSVEEYEDCEAVVPCVKHDWWLRSGGGYAHTAAFVNGENGVDFVGDYVYWDFGVRPALRISDLKSGNFQIGDKIKAAGLTWTVISDNMILCDSIIARKAFREDWKAPDANDFDASDVRKFLHAWAKENGIEVKEREE